MSIINEFTEWMVDATIVTITQAKVNGRWEDTETEGATIQGVKYRASSAERYFNQTWAADVSDVFVTESSAITSTDLLKINGVTYDVDADPDDVGMQGDVYVIGLRRRA